MLSDFEMAFSLYFCFQIESYPMKISLTLAGLSLLAIVLFVAFLLYNISYRFYLLFPKKKQDKEIISEEEAYLYHYMG